VTSQVTSWLWHRAALAPPDSGAPICTLLIYGFLMDVFDLLSFWFWQISAKFGGVASDT